MMTTAFTAIPEKMTTSAMRFLECDMATFYAPFPAVIIDQDQTHA